MPVPLLPSGTLTFFFTDIEGSTRRWDTYGPAMGLAIARHDELLRAVIENQGGQVFKTVGDAVCAVFEEARQAAAAALVAQRELQGQNWSAVGGLPVRIALHTGAAQLRDQDYFGPVLSRVSRLVGAAHGQQVLLSQATADLVADDLPPGAALRDLGEHRLKDLARPERIFQLHAEELRAEFPPLRTLDWRPNNLPTQLTGLLGRERELALARELLLERGVRLLTLTGPGGVGKTHLALQIAADLLHEFEDGAYWVPLAGISDPSLVIPAIASAVGVREVPGETTSRSLAGALRDRQILLLLDNSEQVLASATEIGELLSACPRLHMVVTSRALLRLYGEQDLPVEPLHVPESRGRPEPDELLRYDAIQLYTERARAVRPEFAITSGNAEAVSELCRRLDGLPLAIELAAAQVRLLTPQATLARIAGAPDANAPLRIIGQGPRDVPLRHQSLDANIAWSYELLSEEECALFRRLAVFIGSCGFESLERVCAQHGIVDPLDTLASLIDKSLVRVDEHRIEPRYRMLETIRAFAVHKLAESGEEPSMRRMHRDYFLDVVESSVQGWWGPAQSETLARLELDQDNIRAALSWSLAQGEIEEGLRLAASVWRFWEARGRLREGRDWLERLLARADNEVSDDVRARALSGAGSLAFRQGDYAGARELQETSLALRRDLGTVSGIAMSLSHLGDVARQLGELKEARRHYEESLALRRSINYRAGVAISLTKLGLISRIEGDLDQAQSLFEESLSLHREVGNRSWEAAVLNYLGRVAFYTGDLERARSLHTESLQLRRETGDRWEMAMVLSHLGDAEILLGNPSEARAALNESLRHWHDLGDAWGIAYALECLGHLFHEQGDLVHAVRLFAASGATRARLSTPPSEAGRERLQRVLEACRAALGMESYQQIWDVAAGGDTSALIREMLADS